ncbi:MAG TPA: glutamate-5-semialdehyde dehydrogenase [Candidatus Acutalibacter pullistercoris]|uniref:Gamma-glutamyl phosphate reductase n=1 Tax=Candidatus Acutalibacter pullistercoris TaxID=2838418 RepID=A0A9D1YC08_9FIRM|nr:glutamate-5-semialdehyde dehydrogenase [Candidatus Acutalibacter pullistercoris]
MGAKAKEAARALGKAGAKKTAALELAAAALWDRREEILNANGEDVAAGEAAGMRPSLLDRLRLTEERIAAMAQAVREVAAAPDPVGRVLSGEVRPNGLQLQKVTVPLGVIGIIYEARPNVTSDAAALCLKAGNAVILRGGKEAFRSNQAVAEVLRDALEAGGLPRDGVQLVQDTSRQSAGELMALTQYLDVLIPRGGAGLIRSVKENAKVPVIETGVGNCHAYVDASADLCMAAEVVYNGKCSRPSVCNALETLLVHKDIAEQALPLIQSKLAEKQVELRGCERTRAILPGITPAREEDWETEYGDYILAVKVVDSLEEALAHIARYSSGHSEVILTRDYQAAQRFLEEVDSAAVYVNASTRFTDGGEFGLGAEIGISTQKLHARGPMGLGQLTSTKFLIRGSGQVR